MLKKDIAFLVDKHYAKIRLHNSIIFKFRSSMYRQYLSSQNTGRTVTTIEVVASSDFLGKTEREGNLTLPVGSCDM